MPLLLASFCAVTTDLIPSLHSSSYELDFVLNFSICVEVLQTFRDYFSPVLRSDSATCQLSDLSKFTQQLSEHSLKFDFITYGNSINPFFWFVSSELFKRSGYTCQMKVVQYLVFTELCMKKAEMFSHVYLAGQQVITSHCYSQEKHCYLEGM